MVPPKDSFREPGDGAEAENLVALRAFGPDYMKQCDLRHNTEVSRVGIRKARFEGTNILASVWVELE